MPRTLQLSALVTLVAVLSTSACSKRGSKKVEDTPPERSAQTASNFEGVISKPVEARVDLSDSTLTKVEGPLVDTLLRYLAGNPRWEIREERGLRFAIRKEEVAGSYVTSLNGFYSAFDGEVMHQTRVLISFGKAYEFGDEHGNVTRVRPGQAETEIIIEGDHSGIPGNSSYLIVEGDGVFLEIYDQAPALERSFTQAAFDDVSAELAEVLKHQKEIDTEGVMPVPKRYPLALPREASLTVGDGMQPGIYVVRGAVQTKEPGSAYIKAFSVAKGERLSEERTKLRTLRYLGWSKEGTKYFPYESEVTIYEGDWKSAYEARFELWHQGESGEEVKLAETTRSIHGWQR